MPIKDVSSKVNFVQLEQDMLKHWKETDAFNKLRQLRKDAPEHWSFVDGPITANNPMGVHHAWGRTYKDLYNRYQAMLGKELRWQQGFDCQGLWVEVNVEKDLGFQSKRDIEAYGLAEFIKLCKMRVLQFAAVQTAQSIRLGYWMDWNNLDELEKLRRALEEDDQQTVTIQGTKGAVTGTAEQVVGQLGMPHVGGSYFTFSDENNYQIWRFLKTVEERGWLYKGTDVMPWCARCGTGISQHEIVTDGYKDTTHESVYVKFPLVGRQNEALLVWTTTPWTLTSNVAAAVGPELVYAQVRHNDGWTYYLAKEAMKSSLIGKEGTDYEVVAELKGSELLGWEYTGPFDELPIQNPEALALSLNKKTAEQFARLSPANLKAMTANVQALPDAEHEYIFGSENEDKEPPKYIKRVISWKDVGADEGTGIVHIAPGCGAEDFGLSKEHNLPVVAPLDENGIYGEGFGWLSGRSVMETSLPEEIFADLRQKGVFYRKQKYTHRYPHCWRCATELVYRLVDEWFISMGELYDKPREEVTAEEKAASLRYQIMDSVDQANWYPSFGYDREMDWLRNMHDWMISKKRYWGLALPIWVFPDGSYHVVGSQEELRELAVEGWETFEGHTPHRPYIDAVKIRHPHKEGLVGERIKDVGNPWLDAGIVAISTLHYSEDPEYWAKWYPADWISESFPGQFRNWFYSLLAQSTVLTGSTPFKNLFSYATLLAEDGRAMHKSWGNSIEFNEAADQMGADTMRWLYASCKPEKDLRFGFAVGDETRRRFLIPLWNVYSFFTTYASLDGWIPRNSKEFIDSVARDMEQLTTSGEYTDDQIIQLQNEKLDDLEARILNPIISPDAGNAQMDEWIIARLDETTLAMRAALDVYDAERATQVAEAFLEDLSNWYVRRSRRRFWRSEADGDKSAAYATLYHVLVTYAKLLAPFIPFTAEAMYQNLVRGVDPSAPESIHHHLYPSADPSALNTRLLAKMRLAINTASLGRAARASADVKLRQPLAKARVNVGSQQEEDDLRELAEVIAEEMNVKAIEIVSEVGELVSYKLLPNNAVLGPKFGKLFPKVRQALTAVNPTEGARLLQAGQAIALTVDGEAIALSGEDVLVQTEARGEAAVASEKGVTVAVDTHLTEALLQEGYARDLVRLINNLRKDTGLEIADRIALVYSGEGVAVATLTNFAGYIQAETLAVSLAPGDPSGATAVLETAVGDSAVVIGLSKV